MGKEQGIIVAHYGVAVDVLFMASGKKEMVRVKRNSGHVVGDRVEVEDEVLSRLERKAEISRMDARGGVHVVGANLDVLCLVVACEPLPPPGFIDRAVVAARSASLTPVILINKMDLSCAKDYQAGVEALYQDSLAIFQLSAVTAENIEELSKYFAAGHRGIFVGPTGVGKSSILNRLIPELELATGAISETRKKGRHTTTVSTLHFLASGGELIDSPGFSDFGLVDITTSELAAFFPGFEELSKTPCRFRDCRHKKEPGCQIREGVSQGWIKTERYKTYLQLLQEVEMQQSQPKYREKRHRRKKN